MRVEASAPCRVELGGGAAGGATVGVAIDRRAWCRVEAGIEGVEVESKDALRKARAADVSGIPAGGPLGLVARVLHGLQIESGVRVVTQSRVPEGSGLGESAALAVAVAAAAARACARAIGSAEIERVAAAAAAPALADAGLALRGGALVLETGPGGPRLEALAADPGRIEESLLLIQCEAALPALAGAEIAAAASVAMRVREALASGRLEDLVALWLEEWAVREPAAPEEACRVASRVREAGGAVRACGGRGGRVLAAWAPPGARGPGPREALVEAARAGGWRLVPARLDLRGLDVE